MDRGLRIGAAHRRSAGPVDPSRPHCGDERGKLSAEGQQTDAAFPTSFLIKPPADGRFCRSVPLRRAAGLRSSRTAQIPEWKASDINELVYSSPPPVV